MSSKLQLSLSGGTERFESLSKRSVPPPPPLPPLPTTPNVMFEDSNFNINCWIEGDDYNRIFSIKISRDENVDALKVAIKARNQIALKDVDAVALILHHVSIPPSPELAEHVAASDKLKLNALDTLSEVFANGLLAKHVNVVVEVPQAYGAWVYVVLWSLR